jgi:pseudouridine-5'-phosphate glycosidase/sugar/nucleoside kinase (ribokinase family)
MSNLKFETSQEVQRAIAQRTAVVALESTIITHGMPFPANLETALAVEAAVRAQGATPATIAVLDGVVHVGLEREQLERVASLGSSCRKVSRRDVAHVVAAGAHGATTVAGTMLIAHRAGIHVFVTGGIGGVHRGGEVSMDVSADLAELARTPVAVVCAGVKSILDIGRTVERLETDGVSLVAFQTDEVPAFYTRHSGVPAPLRLDAERDVALLIAANQRLALNSGVVLCVPVPPADEADAEAVERATKQALQETVDQHVGGRDITPHVLKRVAELTGGASLQANIKLVLNNARVGARVAVELNRILHGPAAGAASASAAATPSLPVGVAVVGGAVCDVIARPLRAPTATGDKNRGIVQLAAGGVGRNIAQAIAQLGTAGVRLVTVVSADPFGHFVMSRTRAARVDVASVSVLPAAAGERTAVYNGMLDATGELSVGVSDMAVFDALTPALVLPRLELSGGDIKLVVLDGNVPQDTIVAVCKHCAEHKVRVWFDATSVTKCVKVVPVLNSIAFLSTNAAELRAITDLVVASAAPAATTVPEGGADATTDVAVCATKLLQRTAIGTLVTSLGADGVQLATRTAAGAVRLRRFAAPRIEKDKIVTTNGAGDALIGGVIDAHVLRNVSLPDAITFATELARKVLLGGGEPQPTAKL